MKISLEQLKAACRSGDLMAETLPLPQVFEWLGLDIADVAYIANQRAMRMVLIEDGTAIPTVEVGFKFTEEQRDRLSRYATAYMDAFLIATLAQIQGEPK